MKLLALLVLSLSLTSCGYFDRLGANVTGYSTSCIGNVEYLQFASGVTVAYTNEGKVKTC